MKNLLLMVFVLNTLMACSTNTNYKDLMSQKESSSNETVSDYAFLFEKSLNYHNTQCVAAFSKEEMLYIVAKESNLYQLTVYNPQTGLFVTAAATFNNFISCKEVVLEGIRVQYVAWLHAIVSPDFKRIFDNFKNNPKELKNTISSGPSYFRSDGKWKGEKSTINFPDTKFRDMNTIEDMEYIVRQLNVRHATNLINARMRVLKRYKKRDDVAKEKNRQEKIHESKIHNLAQKQWDNRLSQKLSIGDKVCSYKNFFGYLEKKIIVK